MLLDPAIAALKEMEFVQKIGKTEVVSEAIGVAALVRRWNWPAGTIMAKASCRLHDCAQAV